MFNKINLANKYREINKQEGLYPKKNKFFYAILIEN